MKVIQENHHQMTLCLRPWLLWGVGCLATIAGLLTPLLASVDSFTCRRDSTTQGNCEISRTRLLGTNQQILSLENIQGTNIDISSSRNNKNSYTLILLTNDGEISAIKSSVSNYQTVYSWWEQIEEFLQDEQQQYLFIEYDHRWQIYLFSILVVFSGIETVLSGKVVFCKIDKTLGILNLEKYGLIGKSQVEYNIRDIQGLTVETSTDRKGMKSYRVALVIESGEYIPFTSYYSAELNQEQQIVDTISKFLNIKPIIFIK
jgi:hypothetical protein